MRTAALPLGIHRDLRYLIHRSDSYQGTGPISIDNRPLKKLQVKVLTTKPLEISLISFSILAKFILKMAEFPKLALKHGVLLNLPI